MVLILPSEYWWPTEAPTDLHCFISLAVLEHEQMYLENLPCAEYYEKSYMHRDTVTHVVVTK